MGLTTVDEADGLNQFHKFECDTNVQPIFFNYFFHRSSKHGQLLPIFVRKHAVVLPCCSDPPSFYFDFLHKRVLIAFCTGIQLTKNICLRIFTMHGSWIILL